MPADTSHATPPDRPSDEELVTSALTGDAQALSQLLRRQEPWLFNLALYMLHHRQDAEDATQEILVKIATGLGGFRAESRFFTWARRIAVNHLLDFRRSRPEQVVTGFGCYSEYLDNAPDSDFLASPEPSSEKKLLVEEARISCTLGMLLCLDRGQRVVFLLGEILETSDVVGAELLGITPDNFRQRLSRAREQLTSFLSGRCGLVDANNPCRCARKTAAFIRDQIVDPQRLLFTRGHLANLSSVVGDRHRDLGALLGKTREELRQLYPLFEPSDLVGRLQGLLESQGLKSVLQLN